MLGITLAPNELSADWDFVEIQFEKAVSFNLDWKYLGPRYGVHAPYYITLANPNRQKGDYAVHQVVEAAKIGRKLNADIVVVRAGFYSKQKPEEAMETVVRNCEEILKRIDIPLGVETQGKATEFGSLEEITTLAERIGITPVLNLREMKKRNELDMNILKAMKNPYIHFDETIDMEELAHALPEKYTLVAETKEAAETMDVILSPY